MEAQMANTLASVASHDETVRCLLAIELSKSRLTRRWSTGSAATAWRLVIGKACLNGSSGSAHGLREN
jgi:hypothetical protein